MFNLLVESTGDLFINKNNKIYTEEVIPEIRLFVHSI